MGLIINKTVSVIKRKIIRTIINKNCKPSLFPSCINVSGTHTGEDD